MSHRSSPSSRSPERNTTMSPSLASLFSSQAVLLDDSDDAESVDWYPTATLSPSSLSPVTFMTDSNRSAPTPPPQPHTEHEDYYPTATVAAGSAPALVSLGDTLCAREDVETDTQHLETAAMTTKVKSDVTFRSSLFSSSTTSASSASSRRKKLGSSDSLSSPASSVSVSPRAKSDDSAASTRPASPSALDVENQGKTPPLSSSRSDSPSMPMPATVATTDPSAAAAKGDVPSESRLSSLALSSLKTQKASRASATLKEDRGDAGTADKGSTHSMKKVHETPPIAHSCANQEKKDKLVHHMPQDLRNAKNAPMLPTSQLQDSTGLPAPRSLDCGTSPVVVENLPDLAAPLSRANDCASLSQLAFDLLHGETPAAEGQMLARAGSSAKEMSWVPRSLPLKSTKKTKREARQRAPVKKKTDENGSMDSSPTAEESDAVPGSASITTDGNGDLAATRTPRRKKPKIEKSSSSPSASFDVKSESGEARKERAHGSTSVTAETDDVTAPPSPLLRASAPRSTAPQLKQGREEVSRQEAGELPLLSLSPPVQIAEIPFDLSNMESAPPAQTLDEMFGEFSVENCTIAPYLARYGDENTGSLSQLSFLVAGGAPFALPDEEARTPPSRKRARRPKKHVQPLPQEMMRGLVFGRGVMERLPPIAPQDAKLLPPPAEDDELLIAKDWWLPESITNDAQPASQPTPPSQAKRKRAKKVQLDNEGKPHGSSSSLTEPPATAQQEGASDPLAWWETTCAVAALRESPWGRPCLWIELSDAFQETHSALLRQLLVYWGCIHRTKHSCLRTTASPATSQSSAASDSRRKRARRRLQQSSENSQTAPSLCSDSLRARGGVVVLLCPPSMLLAEELRWWTQRAHAAHAYMPPLFAISVAAEGAARTTGQSLAASPAAASSASFNRDDLMARAVLYGSCDIQMDPRQSLAVTCTARGFAALTQILPQNQVHTSLESCATMLGDVLRIPPLSPVVNSTVVASGKGPVDVGSLAAVMTTPTSSSEPCSSAVDRKKPRTQLPVSLQDECFEELCTWSGLAVHLRDRPRRPQLVLHRVLADVVSESPSQINDAAVERRTSSRASAGDGAPTKESAAPGSTLWITYGLVRPATQNEETFANTARRDARLLTSRAPPVTILSAHMSALTLFASEVFTRDNYVTAANVVTSHTHRPPRRTADYISGYSCVVTGPLRYAISATVRRYLHVQLSVNAAPLLALVSAMSKSCLAECKDTELRKEAAARDDSFAAASTAEAVVLLARTQWRLVLCALSCTCTPRIYEQVPHTADGVKLCRHIAELFYYFVTQQFCAVCDGQRDEWNVISAFCVQRSKASRAKGGDASSPMPLVEAPVKRTDTSFNATDAAAMLPRSLPSQSTDEESRSSSDSESDMVLNNIPLSVLYNHSHSTLASREHSEDAELSAVGVGGNTTATSATQLTDTSSLGPTSSHAKRRKAVDTSTVVAPAASEAGPTSRSPPPPPLSVEGGFHTEALEYALQYIAQRRVAGGNDAPADSVSPDPAATMVNNVVGAPGEGVQPAKKKRSAAAMASEKEEEARALRLVEQLLRNALS